MKGRSDVAARSARFSWCVGPVALGLTCALPANAWAQSEASVIPPSPGALVLQATEGGPTAAVGLCGAAFRSNDPRMRGAGARLALAGGFLSLLPDLDAVLARETDPAALGEEVRAAVLLGGEKEIAAALTAVTRARAAAIQLTEALAVAHPDTLAALVPAIGALNVPRELGAGCWDATRRSSDPQVTVALAEGAFGQGKATWLAFLDSATRDGKAVNAAVMVKAVTDLDPTVLAPTILRLAALAAGPSRIAPAPAVVEALDRRLAAAGMPRSFAAFARDLLDRAVRGEPKTRMKWAAEITAWSTSTLSDLEPALAGPLGALLTSAERKALAAHGSRYQIPSGTAREPRRRESRPAAENSQPRVVTRTFGDMPAGVMETVAGAAGCEPAAGQRALAKVTFKDTARVTHVQLDDRLLTSGCARALRALAQLVLPAPIGSHATPALVRADFDPEVLACEAGVGRAIPVSWPGTNEAAARASHSSGNIRPPKKLVNVAPVYPQALLDARAQGVVVVEATISETGCVYGATVTMSPGAAFDVAALDAIVRWRFTPTLLDGRAVPVIMTVTVRFGFE